jgi:exopolyphosphatase/guanosine-5'-triphosphate,3'-diphosphate pyrophosphatase
MTYLGIQHFLEIDPSAAETQTIVIEVGAGTTEMLFLQEDQVTHSHTYRLGALRLREALKSYRGAEVRKRAIMEGQIRRTLEQAGQHLPVDARTRMIALGGDIRLAAGRLVPEWAPNELARVSVADLASFTDKVLEKSEDALVRQYGLTFPDAETLGPALLVYVELGRIFGLDEMLVTRLNLRDSLLQEMAAKELWTDEFREQIVRSALDLGAKFEFDAAHARHVAKLSSILFHALQDEHTLEPRFELLLYVAALLHEIGLFISTRSMHKHSMYLILNSELFGLTQHDKLLVALVARYHRRASPKPTHQGYTTLDRDDRIVVAKLAAILRLADALDDSRSQRIREIRCEASDGKFVISIPRVEDLALEQLAIQQNGSMFEEIFGMPVLLRKVRS